MARGVQCVAAMKLALRTETVRTLCSAELDRARGGFVVPPKHALEGKRESDPKFVRQPPKGHEIDRSIIARMPPGRFM